MDLISPILRYVALPAFARWRGDESFRFAREAHEMLGWPADRVSAYQWERTLDMLRFAEAKSRFYGRRFAEYGVRISEIKAPEDLRRLPVLTKQDLREHLDEMTPDGVTLDPAYRAATGGSTDSPTPFYRDRQTLSRRQGWTQTVRSRWWGWHPGDKTAFIWGAPQDFIEVESLRYRFRRRYLERTLYFPSWKFNRSILAEYAESIGRFSPRIISGYSSAVALFCEYLLEENLTHIRPHAAILTAEPLYPAQREVIARAFDCEVFNFLGTRENGMVAAECGAHRGLHVNSLSVNLEFDAGDHEAQPGEVGRVLITDLENRATPLIRYENGDAASPMTGACPCGAGLPSMEFSAGRTTDVFVRADGTYVPGVSLTARVIQRADGIARLQIVQETLSEFRVRIVRGHGFSEQDERELAANLRNFLGDAIQIQFEPVDELPLSASGKQRFCISKVGIRWDAKTGKQVLS